MQRKYTLIDRYYILWVFFVPVTSVLVFPHVQGTTAGYLMCFFSVVMVLAYGGRGRIRYTNFLLIALVVWITMLAITQLSDATVSSEPDLRNVMLVDETDTRTFVMRASLLTQSIYLAAVFLYVDYVYIYYEPRWDRWLIAAGTLFAMYGLYEAAFYAATGTSGDFLSNRSFGKELNAGVHGNQTVNGSSFQVIYLAGFASERLKSLTGEPSMYALSMFPFWIYTNAMAKSRLPAWILALSLILSTSTTAVAGYICYFLIHMAKFRIKPIRAILGVFALCVICYFSRDYLADFYEQMIVNKLTGSNQSGSERSAFFSAALDMWSHESLVNQIFGIGFGYIRSTDLFSTLLVNTGVIGVSLVTIIMLYPAFKLDWEPKGLALRQCCVATWVMMMVSVPEFSYLAPWTFVAIAYSHLYRARQSPRPTPELSDRTRMFRAR